MVLAFFVAQICRKGSRAWLNLFSIGMHAFVPVKLHLQVLLRIGGFFQFGKRNLEFAVTGSTDRGDGNGTQPLCYPNVAF